MVSAITVIESVHFAGGIFFVYSLAGFWDGHDFSRDLSLAHGYADGEACLAAAGEVSALTGLTCRAGFSPGPQVGLVP